MTPHDAVLRALELGLSTSRSAPGELRKFIAAFGPGLQDLRCAAVTALACTAGSDATSDFADLLADPTRAVRECAADILFHVGDGRAWDSVFGFYQGEVRQRGPRRAPLPPAMPLSYLLVQAESGSQGAAALVGFLREEWARLSEFERQWLGEHAPGIAPGGPRAEAVLLPGRDGIVPAPEADAGRGPAPEIDRAPSPEPSHPGRRPALSET